MLLMVGVSLRCHSVCVRVCVCVCVRCVCGTIFRAPPTYRSHYHRNVPFTHGFLSVLS